MCASPCGEQPLASSRGGGRLLRAEPTRWEQELQGRPLLFFPSYEISCEQTRNELRAAAGLELALAGPSDL